MSEYCEKKEEKNLSMKMIQHSQLKMVMYQVIAAEKIYSDNSSWTKHDQGINKGSMRAEFSQMSSVYEKHKESN